MSDKEGFTLGIDTEPTPPVLHDREVMVQVLTNLIENSVKFGVDSVRKEIAVRLRSDGDHVTLSVSDTGPGIPHGALAKVFDDFYRVDNSLTRTVRGTGIGLALVKKFVTAMGGTVRARNNTGPGCTIEISLGRKKQRLRGV